MRTVLILRIFNPHILYILYLLTFFIFLKKEKRSQNPQDDNYSHLLRKSQSISPEALRSATSAFKRETSAEYPLRVQTSFLTLTGASGAIHEPNA